MLPLCLSKLFIIEKFSHGNIIVPQQVKRFLLLEKGEEKWTLVDILVRIETIENLMK